MTMKPVALLAALMVTGLAAAPARAESRVLLAECGDAGCTCRLTPLPLSEFELVTGVAPPPGAADMVLIDHKGTYRWSASLPDAIDREMGGDGVCPIELFTLTPLDGTWKSSVRVQDVQGCLPQVAQMVPPLVDGTGDVKPIAWGGKFHPSRLASGDAPDLIRWTERSPTAFDGTVPVPQSGVLKVTVTATATLTAPDRAEATMALRLAAADGADAGALAMLGMADCRVDAVYDFTRVAP